ncbi:MAG: SagB/ThcOx family dehydrogenase [Thermoprotei archaeon]|jgi:SagB-type dehydrogenase family enzyme
MYKERLIEYIKKLDENESKDLLTLIELAKSGNKLWKEEPGITYHKYSKHSKFRIFMTPRRIYRGPLPQLIKRYKNAEVIRLPPPNPSLASTPTGINIATRRSFRDFKPKPISLDILSTLLYLVVGITAWENQWPLRAYPSAGALQPVEAYIIANYVNDINMGLYHYNPQDHTLEVLKKNDLRRTIVNIALDQDFLYNASIILILSTVYLRTLWKYGDRAYRYSLLDTGAAMENAYLAATSMGLGACAIGAYYDDDLNALLGLDENEEITQVMIAIGHKK